MRAIVGILAVLAVGAAACGDDGPSSAEQAIIDSLEVAIEATESGKPEATRATAEERACYAEGIVEVFGGGAIQEESITNEQLWSPSADDIDLSGGRAEGVVAVLNECEMFDNFVRDLFLAANINVRGTTAACISDEYTNDEDSRKALARFFAAKKLDGSAQDYDSFFTVLTNCGLITDQLVANFAATPSYDEYICVDRRTKAHESRLDFFYFNVSGQLSSEAGVEDLLLDVSRCFPTQRWALMQGG